MITLRNSSPPAQHDFGPALRRIITNAPRWSRLRPTTEQTWIAGRTAGTSVAALAATLSNGRERTRRSKTGRTVQAAVQRAGVPIAAPTAWDVRCRKTPFKRDVDRAQAPSGCCGRTDSHQRRGHLGHGSLIDHNPRKVKRSSSHRTRRSDEKARTLKDGFGADCVPVRGHAKVSLHRMLGVRVPAAGQRFGS